MDKSGLTPNEQAAIDEITSKLRTGEFESDEAREIFLESTFESHGISINRRKKLVIRLAEERASTPTPDATDMFRIPEPKVPPAPIVPPPQEPTPTPTIVEDNKSPSLEKIAGRRKRSIHSKIGLGVIGLASLAGVYGLWEASSSGILLVKG